MKTDKQITVQSSDEMISQSYARMLLKLHSGHSSLHSSSFQPIHDLLLRRLHRPSCIVASFLEVTRPAGFPLVQDKAFKLDVILFPTSLRQRLDPLRPIPINLDELSYLGGRKQDHMSCGLGMIPRRPRKLTGCRSHA
jgi:hypothetical protein